MLLQNRKVRTTSTIALLTLLALITIGAHGQASRVAIERAVRHIELGDFALARSHLELPLIDGRISAGERSRAYYLQGYSLERQSFHVSAGQNYAKALAFNPDNPATLAALGCLYRDGLGVTRNLPRATQLLRRSAELGHGPGMTGLGALLLVGLPDSNQPQEDLAEARQWLNQATKATSPAFMTPRQDAGTALLLLAQSYRAGVAIDPDPDRALVYYQQALILNKPEAFNSIGHMHSNGEFGTKNIAAAITAFTRGAESGDSASQVSLGYLYLSGNGLPAARNTARDLFTRAATAGDVRGHYYLGYLDETADPARPNSARNHYQAAARSNHLPALVRLSELAFANNQPQKGIGYLSRAAGTGDATANNQLAWLLATSRDPSLRNGRAAVGYAEAAVAITASADTLDTLAAAYAENRQFGEAVTTQNQALAMLAKDRAAAQSRDKDNRKQADFSARLAFYQRAEPWRSKPKEASAAEPTATL